jgi:hypothetical protein
MITASMFRKTVESVPASSFSHRKVRANGGVIDSVKIPVSVLEAVKSASRIEAGPQGSAKQCFERLVLEAVVPGASQGLKNSEITSLVSHMTDAWFPKDEGEFKTHPISREVAQGEKGLRPVAYFWKEESTPSQEGGARCAPRPFRGESADVSSMTPEDILGKANSEEKGRLLRGEISPLEMVEAVKTRLTKKTAPRVDEATIARMVAEQVAAQLAKMGITPPPSQE